MKTLFLVRHAKSSWDDSSLTDFERKLNDRGKRDAPFMARKFAEKRILVESIIASPAKRAITTAEFFAMELKIEIHTSRKIYEASLADLLQIVSSLPEDINSVMLFGHNPGFSYLATHLTGESMEMPTCAIAHIEISQEKWAHTTANSGHLVSFDYPKKYFS